MNLKNPKIELFFMTTTPEHGRSQTIGSDFLVKGSVAITYQLLNGLKPASNRAQVSVISGCTAIEDVISYEGNIGATLSDDEGTWFTGFLSTDWQWRVTATGVQAISLTIEDIGTRLLKKSFIQTGSHLFRCTAKKMFDSVCEAAGVTVSPLCIQAPGNVVRVAEAGETCADLLSQMLYELGSVYFFDSAGELRLFNVKCSDTPKETVDSTRLCGSSSGGVSVRKSIRKQTNVKVRFTELGTRTDTLVYRNITGQDVTHPYCNFDLLPGAKFDGTEIWREDDWSDATTREPALIEACNAESLDEIGSHRIVAIENVRKEYVYMGGTTSASIDAAGGPYLSVSLENKGDVASSITRLDAYADAIYEKGFSIVRAGTEAGETIDEELKYIHNEEDAKRHAEILLAYSRNSSATYTFQAKGLIQPGTVLRLKENVHSGLEVTVLVYAVKLQDGCDISSCTAVGISSFKLDDEFFSRTVTPSSTALKGDKGDAGESYTVVVESTNGSVFRKGTASTILSCHVYCNGTEITETMDDSAFMWKRSSGNAAQDASWANGTKAMCHKSVEILPEDCPGRTVFFCEVDLPTKGE